MEKKRTKRLKRGDQLKVILDNSQVPEGLEGFYGTKGDVIEFVAYAGYNNLIYFNFVHVDMSHPLRQYVPLSEYHPDDWPYEENMNSPEGVYQMLMEQDKQYGMWCIKRDKVDFLISEYKLDQLLDEAEDLL